MSLSVLPRLRRLLLCGLFAGAAGVVTLAARAPARAQYNPYCYAPYYNPYYCEYYSYYYPYYGYPYYGFGFGLGFGHPFFHREIRRFHRGFAVHEFREFHHPGVAVHRFREFPHPGIAARRFHRGFVGGEFHGRALPSHAGGTAPVRRFLTPMFNYAHRHR